MLEAAAKLAKGFSFIRVDLYTNGTDFKVGEITNCHGSGMQTLLGRVEAERSVSVPSCSETRNEQEGHHQGQGRRARS